MANLIFLSELFWDWLGWGGMGEQHSLREGIRERAPVEIRESTELGDTCRFSYLQSCKIFCFAKIIFH